VTNPLVHFVYITDEDFHIIGFFKADLNPLERIIFLDWCSIDRKHQSPTSGLQQEIINHLFGVAKQIGFNQKIMCAVTRPNALTAYGFKKSKRTLMEIEYVEPKLQSEPPKQQTEKSVVAMAS
jgi:hypothetical protein